MEETRTRGTKTKDVQMIYSKKKYFQHPKYLILPFFPHAQGEHRVEVWAGDSQQGSVSRDPLVVSHQHHVTELAVAPLLIETLQHLQSLIHPTEHLSTQCRNVVLMSLTGNI